VRVCAKRRHLSVCVAKCYQYRQTPSPDEHTRRPALDIGCSAIWLNLIGRESASRGPSALADITRVFNLFDFFSFRIRLKQSTTSHRAVSPLMVFHKLDSFPSSLSPNLPFSRKCKFLREYSLLLLLTLVLGSRFQFLLD